LQLEAVTLFQLFNLATEKKFSFEDFTQADLFKPRSELVRKDKERHVIITSSCGETYGFKETVLASV